MKDHLERLTREQLMELAEVSAKNLVALDGVWFQAVEQSAGMGAAMDRDEEAWRRFPKSEARRLKALLGLGNEPGLDGLERVLGLCHSTLANDKVTMYREQHEGRESLVYRVDVCRVQQARLRKGLGLHPCKRAGMPEYGELARAVDPRIVCECISCYPDQTLPDCGCAWRFMLEEPDSRE